MYATTAGSPYVYRNFMVCTQYMGDNDIHGLWVKYPPRDGFDNFMWPLFFQASEAAVFVLIL